MADFLYEFILYEGHPTRQICLVNLMPKSDYITPPQITQFSLIFNEYEIRHFG